MTNYMRICSFLHAHFAETMKVVENLFLKKTYGEKTHLLKVICCRYTLDLPLFQCVPSTYATENKENYLELYT